MLCGAFFATTIQADDVPASTRKPNAQGKRNMRRGGGQMRFDPMMILAFQVKNQKKVTAEFLQKAKDGELKMPQKNQRRRGGRGGKGGKRPARNQD